MSNDAQALELRQYLSFFVAGEEFAVGILKVREILQHDTITKVPRTPPWIRGVINLRGSVVPVVDLTAKFGLGETPVTSATCIVIVEADLAGELIVMGVLADAVSEVIELGAGDIEEPPGFGTPVHVDYLLGMGKAGSRLVLLLDIDKVLTSDELVLTASSSLAAAEAEPSSPGLAEGSCG